MNNKCKVVVCDINGKLVTINKDVDFYNFSLSEAKFTNEVAPGNYIIMMIDNETRKMQMVARVDVEETVEDSAIVTGDNIFYHKALTYPVKVYTDLCPGFTTTTLVDTPDKLMEFAEIYNSTFYFDDNEYIQCRFRKGSRRKHAILVQRMF